MAETKKERWVHFINILHTRKPPTDKDGKVRFVTEYEVLGSGTFVQSSDANIILNRDKMAASVIDRNTTIIDIPKWRVVLLDALKVGCIMTRKHDNSMINLIG